MTYPWRWLIHFTGTDYTGRYGHVVPYSFWSGVAGSFLVGVLAWFFGYYVHHTCHYAWWCMGWAHVPIAGGIAGTCHRHAPHPDLAGKRRPRGTRLHDLHFAWEARQREKP